MNVSYTAPLQQSWSRMVRMLFRPFRLETWIVLGFAAFLSEYLSHLSGGGKFSGHGRPGGHVPEAVRHAAAFLMNPVWAPIVIAIVALAAIAALAFMWVSSRGKFIFLDDVMRERSAIVEPWKRYARHGNALFAFWLGLTLVCAALFIMITLPLLPAILGAIAAGGAWQVLGAIAVSWWVAAMIPLALIVGFVHLLLFQFVVPIMYRHDLGVFAAWGRFFSLFRQNVQNFIAFGLFFLILLLALGTAIFTVGIFTCCIGFLLLAIPYIGSVILLPVEVTLRGLGPDFLAQFGPEWNIVPSPSVPPAA